MLPFFLAFLAGGAGFRTVDVDAARVTGKIRSFQGVVDGPLVPRGRGDLSSQYKALRIDFIRIHDLFGPADIDARWTQPDRIASGAGATGANTIFPNWSADPERPESYNFAPTDPFIQAMVGCWRAGLLPDRTKLVRRPGPAARFRQVRQHRQARGHAL
jgi:hypothetical protein